MKPAESAQVEFIKDLLRKGLQRKTILEEFGKKWSDLGRSTFDNRLKVAKRALALEIQQISDKAMEKVDQKAEALAARIMSVTERQLLLTQIAKGQVKVKRPVQTRKGIRQIACEPDHAERIRAINELNKMGGDFGATKTIVQGDEEKPIPVAVSAQTNIDYTKLSTEVLEQLLHARTG